MPKDDGLENVSNKNNCEINVNGLFIRLNQSNNVSSDFEDQDKNTYSILDNDIYVKKIFVDSNHKVSMWMHEFFCPKQNIFFSRPMVRFYNIDEGSFEKYKEFLKTLKKNYQCDFTEEKEFDYIPYLFCYMNKYCSAGISNILKSEHLFFYFNLVSMSIYFDSFDSNHQVLYKRYKEKNRNRSL